MSLFAKSETMSLVFFVMVFSGEKRRAAKTPEGRRGPLSSFYTYKTIQRGNTPTPE